MTKLYDSGGKETMKTVLRICKSPSCGAIKARLHSHYLILEMDQQKS